MPTELAQPLEAALVPPSAQKEAWERNPRPLLQSRRRSSAHALEDSVSSGTDDDEDTNGDTVVVSSVSVVVEFNDTEPDSHRRVFGAVVRLIDVNSKEMQKTQKDAVGAIRKARDTEAGKILSSALGLSDR